MTNLLLLDQFECHSLRSAIIGRQRKRLNDYNDTFVNNKTFSTADCWKKLEVRQGVDRTRRNKKEIKQSERLYHSAILSRVSIPCSFGNNFGKKISRVFPLRSTVGIGAVPLDRKYSNLRRSLPFHPVPPYTRTHAHTHTYGHRHTATWKLFTQTVWRTDFGRRRWNEKRRTASHFIECSTGRKADKVHRTNEACAFS